MTRPTAMGGLTLMALLAAGACGKTSNLYVTAAAMFTQRYSQSSLSKWNVRANAAGADCSILVVETGVPLDDTIVESLQYGAGDYDVWDGGVQQFCRERAFTGVVYRDRAQRTWTYGSITPAEAAALQPCG